MRPTTPRVPRPLSLTKRQCELIVRVCRCPEPTKPQLAVQMHCSEKTVETHRHDVYRKLKVHSRTELVLTAIQLGLVQCPCAGRGAGVAGVAP